MASKEKDWSGLVSKCICKTSKTAHFTGKFEIFHTRKLPSSRQMSDQWICRESWWINFIALKWILYVPKYFQSRKHAEFRNHFPISLLQARYGLESPLVFFESISGLIWADVTGFERREKIWINFQVYLQNLDYSPIFKGAWRCSN